MLLCQQPVIWDSSIFSVPNGPLGLSVGWLGTRCSVEEWWVLFLFKGGMIILSWSVIVQSLPQFVQAWWVTVWMSFVGIALATIVGLIVSLVEYFRVPGFRQILAVYTEIARNTPLLLQLFFLYYAFPVFGWKLSAPMCGIIGLTFLGGAYMADGFMGGFAGVEKTQIESGRALGMSDGQLARYVVFPQGLALSVPAFAANVIFLIKETSIFSVIAIPELTNTALDLIGLYYRSNEYLLVLVLAYAVILIPIILGLNWLERRVRHGAFGN